MEVSDVTKLNGPPEPASKPTYGRRYIFILELRKWVVILRGFWEFNRIGAVFKRVIREIA